MRARFGKNKNGAAPAWRCYGEFQETATTKACLGDNGQRTNEECSDPTEGTGVYCSRQKQLQEIIDAGCGDGIGESLKHQKKFHKTLFFQRWKFHNFAKPSMARSEHYSNFSNLNVKSKF